MTLDGGWELPQAGGGCFRTGALVMWAFAPDRLMRWVSDDRPVAQKT